MHSVSNRRESAGPSNCRISGVKMSCIANPIFPPGTTITFGRDMANESCSMVSKYGKSIPFGRAKRITTKLSSVCGISRAVNGLEVSTVGTRWKLTCVRENCGQM